MIAARPLLPVALLAPSAGLLLLCFALPLATLLLYSLYTSEPGGGMRPVLTLANYARFLLDGLYYRVIWRSLEIGVLTTACCVVLGFPLAYSLARTRRRSQRGLVVMLLLFPLMTSVVVRSYGWLILLGDAGLVNVVLLRLGLIENPVRLL